MSYKHDSVELRPCWVKVGNLKYMLTTTYDYISEQGTYYCADPSSSGLLNKTNWKPKLINTHMIHHIKPHKTVLLDMDSAKTASWQFKMTQNNLQK